MIATLATSIKHTIQIIRRAIRQEKEKTSKLKRSKTVTLQIGYDIVSTKHYRFHQKTVRTNTQIQ